MNFWNSIKNSFKNGGVVVQLIYVNVVVFLLTGAISIVFQLFNFNAVDLTYWFAVPSNLHSLGQYCWTIITYMFYHKQFFHLFFNMLVLFWFGRLFLVYYSPKQLLSLYFTGGIIGALVYILSYNLLPYYELASYYSVLMGASGSILAILVATAVRAPNMEMSLLFLGRIKLMWIAVATILVSFFGLTSENGGGEMAHLGGALAGYLFVLFDKKGLNFNAPIDFVIGILVSIFRPRPKMKKSRTFNNRMKPDEYNQKKAQDENEINRILDKIKSSGYDSLSNDEKRKLFEQKR